MSVILVTVKSERHGLEWVLSISFVNHLIFPDFERNVFGNRMVKDMSKDIALCLKEFGVV